MGLLKNLRPRKAPERAVEGLEVEGCVGNQTSCGIYLSADIAEGKARSVLASGIEGEDDPSLVLS